MRLTKHRKTHKNKKTKYRESTKNSKNRRAIKQIKTKFKKGGMSGIERRRTSRPPSSDFMTFLNNASITYLSSGSNGVTFMATITDTSKSPYVSTDINSYGNPISKVLVKLIFLTDEEEEEDEESVLLPTAINVSKENDFIAEVNTQLCVYEKTKEYLDPICPAIVLSSIIRSADNIQKFLDILSSKGEQPLLNLIKEQANKFKSLGIICMEFADGYDTLAKLRHTGKFLIYRAMAMQLLLELAIKTGFTHGDFHFSNIMINPTATNYVGVSGKPLLIDFGYATPLDANIRRDIIEAVSEKKYLLALQIMCRQNSRNGKQINMWPNKYGWACGANPYFTPEEANRHFFDVKQKLIHDYIADHNAKNPNNKITIKDVRDNDDLDIEFDEQTATELSRAPIDMSLEKMQNLNILIDSMFRERDEIKANIQRISSIPLPLPSVKECTQVSIEELGDYEKLLSEE